MKKNSENPGLLTASKQTNDRVIITVSTQGCITLPEDGSLPFMQQVRENTPVNEREIRSTPLPVSRTALPYLIQDLEHGHPGEDVRRTISQWIESGEVVVY